MHPDSVRALDLSQVRARLHRHGRRLTRLKREVLEALAEAEGAVTVEELTRNIRDGEDPSPVYRCLTGLAEAQIVTQVGLGDGMLRYSLHQGMGRHHDYLVCTRCSIVETVTDACLLAREADAAARRRGFSVEDHQVVVRGLCRRCREEGA